MSLSSPPLPEIAGSTDPINSFTTLSDPQETTRDSYGEEATSDSLSVKPSSQSIHPSAWSLAWFGQELIVGHAQGDILRKKLLPQPILLGEHKNRVQTVVFSPDGKKVISGENDYKTDSDKKIQIIQLADRSVVKTISTRVCIYALACSSNSELLATGGNSGDAIQIYTLATGEPHSRIPRSQNVKLSNNTIYSVVFSPNNTNIAAGGGEKKFLYIEYQMASI
jgi:WD40 repeat protein